MSFIINQNFDLKSPQFNFARDYYADLAALKTACGGNWGNYSSFPDHFITNVGGTLYQYTSGNSVDTNTGKWRKLEFGVTNADFQTALNSVEEKASAAVETAEAAKTEADKNAEDIKVLSNNLANKVDKVTGKGLSTNDYTTAEKNKLAGIAEGANKTVVDTTFSTSSTNPVENRVIKTALDEFSTTVETALDGKASKDVATTTVNGLLSSADKVKLNNLAANASSTYASKSEVSSTYATKNDVSNTYLAKSEIQTLSDDDIDALWNGATA
nr:MAG TPA: hypothetical protein [Caudoviricetes sp.]